MAIGNLQQLIPAIFTGPNGERLTPEQIAQRQEIAQSLIGRATDTSPDAGGWASVLTKGLLGYQSGAGRREADNAIKANADASQSSIAAMLGGLTGGAGFNAPVASGASPTSAVATGTPVAVPSAPEIRQGLIDRGLQPHIADAFILNFQDESGLNPGINEQNPTVPGSRGGFGLYQLTGPRRREYEAFAAQRGVDPADTNAQLDFLMLEGQGKEKSAFDKILASPDTASAAQAIVNSFLRPAEQHRAARSAKYGRVANTPQEAIEVVAPVESTMPSTNFRDRWNAGFLPDGSNLRPFQPGEQINNPDGSYSTELSTTWQLPDGQFVNVPSLWMGDNGPVRFNPEDEQGILGALQQYEFGRGQSFPRFMSAQEAEAAAMQRSNAGGAGAGVSPTASVSPAQSNLLAQNDLALGGSLSPTGTSPVAQALSGYFPDAPTMQQQTPQGMGGINPAVIQALSNPYASQQERKIAGMLLGQQMEQAQAQQQQAQLMEQRQATAQTLGINPALAGDSDAWKASIEQATRNRNTVTVGNTVYDANTGQPVIQGQGDPTSDIQNYEYARNNGFQGSFADYQQQVKRAGATTVDARQMGNIPPGYQVQYNEQGQPISMSPLPGSPDFIKAQKEREAFEKGKVSQERTSQVVTQDIDRAMDLIDKSPFTTTGVAGTALSKLGGTASNDVNQLITTIKANAGFDRLQAMRDASPTGGALGAVSERELTYLQSTIGSLDQSQTKEQLIRNLRRVRQAYSDIIDGPDTKASKPVSEMSNEELEAIINGN